MDVQILNDLHQLLPELLLIGAAMLCLMIGAFQGEMAATLVTRILIAAIAIAIFFFVKEAKLTRIALLNTYLLSDYFIIFIKLLLLIATGVVLMLVHGIVQRERARCMFELPILMVLSLVGMMLMVSSQNFLSLYVGLEMMSLCLYILAAIYRDVDMASEAALKYFVLGALASGFMLFGISLIYGFTGTIAFHEIATISQEYLDIGALIGGIFILVGLFFKVSAVPFHMWVPDVYQGVPAVITAFFTSAPKIAAIGILLRLMLTAFKPWAIILEPILMIIAVLSMYVGAFAALRQTDIKRLMAYSSIGHVGYILIAIMVGTEEAVHAVLLYLGIYMVTIIGVFACILRMRRAGKPHEQISDLSGIAKTHPFMAFAMGVFMLSLAGIPPLAGFFGKFYIFISAIQSGYYILALLGVIASVVSAFYYIRVIKIIYFDEVEVPIEKACSREVRFVANVASLLVLLFFLYPGKFVLLTSKVAHTMF